MDQAWVFFAAVVGAAGSVLSAYIAAKVRQVSTVLNGRTKRLELLVEELRSALLEEKLRQ